MPTNLAEELETPPFPKQGLLSLSLAADQSGGPRGHKVFEEHGREILAEDYHRILGKKARVDIAGDELLKVADVEGLTTAEARR